MAGNKKWGKKVEKSWETTQIKVRLMIEFRGIGKFFVTVFFFLFFFFFLQILFRRSRIG
jgi:hypothetical protein